MTRKRKAWGYSPPKAAKPGAPDWIKTQVAHEAEKLISEKLRPVHINLPPHEPQFNHIVDISTKWYRNYFYFSAKYACPGPNSLSPFFDANFARMEYAGGNRFHLSYMLHTDRWFELYRDVPLGECLDRIGQEPYFHP